MGFLVYSEMDSDGSVHCESPQPSQKTRAYWLKCAIFKLAVCEQEILYKINDNSITSNITNIGYVGNTGNIDNSGIT